MPQIKRLAILDDYQDVTLRLGPWDRLSHVEKSVFRDTLADQDALVERLRPFDAILAMRERTPFPAALIERLPNLRLLITTGERNRGIDVAACAARGVTFSGTPSFGAPTVDLTWGLILALARRIPEQEAAMRAGRWQTAIGTGLEGKTLGLLGFGKLGRRVAAVGKALGMECIAWSQNLTEEAAAQGGARRVEKEALFREADVLTIHYILSERSRGLVGAAELATMKPSALLVNTSRGPIVDQDALIAALREGRLAGAGIDVYDVEPVTADHPLLSAPNTVLTPHLGYCTEENYRVYFEGAVKAIEAFEKGQPIRVITG
ncbi:D-2-hydroxyacid dehydrogenase family protein [Sabulicella glaciei]|uniref:D-2-hydroxyacid dehydrogenase family protein n=1 Tax=Sabulicella glaciei TaxID=2984948 RepID=A0ABT3NS32_9PROT|nr:D-2-hydroxyacid dehydrogenase family protein [Roseococcus sp. MDT2-1-1]MCW8084975.1 D-2-hydroxyacid dehydrogenase family protein [Roseococcus sp. MDT2-1-1]